ncbi:unnamed protein product, partial [Ixodes persulcatus]
LDFVWLHRCEETRCRHFAGRLWRKHRRQSPALSIQPLLFQHPKRVDAVHRTVVDSFKVVHKIAKEEK